MSGRSMRSGVLLAPLVAAAVVLCADAVDLRGRAADAIGRTEAARFDRLGAAAAETPAWPVLLARVGTPTPAPADADRAAPGDAFRFEAPSRDAFAWVRRLEGHAWPEAAHLEFRVAAGRCGLGEAELVEVVFEAAPRGAMEARR